MESSYEETHRPAAPKRTNVLKLRANCGHCRKKITKALEKIDGVHSIRVEAKEGRIGVESSMEPRELLALLAKAGKRIHLSAESQPPLPPSSSSSSSSSSSAAAAAAAVAADDTNTTEQTHARAPPSSSSSSALQHSVSRFLPADIENLVSMNPRMAQMTITDQRVIHMTFNDPDPAEPNPPSSVLLLPHDLNTPPDPKPEPEPEPEPQPQPDHPPPAPAEKTPSHHCKPDSCCLM